MPGRDTECVNDAMRSKGEGIMYKEEYERWLELADPE